MNRRRFIHSASAAMGLGFAPRLRAADQAAPLARLNHAAIGVSGMGKGDLQNIAGSPQVQVVALCDVDANHLAKAAALHPGARQYRDWRELLEAEGDRIDSVNVTVPDHMHAPISLAAMKRGKHCFTQKPLTHQVSEARAMTEGAERHGVITQMGNQIHSHIAYRMGVAFIQGGAIGKVKEVHSWVNARYPQAPRPPGADPVPAHLDWDHWLGVAPERPFKQGIYHPFAWRAWQDFGTGAMGDFGCHILDPVFTALEIVPSNVTVKCRGVEEAWKDSEARYTDSWPAWGICEYEFPGTKYTAGKTLPLTWYDGGKQPPAALAQLPEGHSLAKSGSLFIGEEGVMMLPHVGGPRLFPAEKFKGYPKPDVVPHINHWHTWVDHCVAGTRTSDGFHYAGPLAESVLIGTIALRHSGEELHYDAKALEFTGHAEATKCLSRSYRDGWG